MRDRDDLLIGLSGLTAAEVSRAKFGKHGGHRRRAATQRSHSWGILSRNAPGKLVTLEVGQRGNSSA